jgi:septum site-determining protein MinC
MNGQQGRLHQVRFANSYTKPLLAPMPAPSASRPPTPSRQTFEIKSAQLPLVALLVKSADFDTVALELRAAFGPNGETPDFFERDGLVLDLSALYANHTADVAVQSLVPLVEALHACQLIPVAVRGVGAAWADAVFQSGLVLADNELPRVKTAKAAPQATTSKDTAKELVQEASQEITVREVIRELPSPGAMVVDKPLRSGQKVYAKGCDLVVLAMVNQGAEVVADGNIHVYAALRGKAMAGARGNTRARIFALSLEPELVSIAGVY